MGVDVGAAEKPIIVEQIPTAPAAGDLGFEQLPGPRGVADDLKKLPGVSPAIEKQLNDLGIFHIPQIAELNEKAAHNVGEEVGLPGRVDSWIAKAKELTRGVRRERRHARPKCAKHARAGHPRLIRRRETWMAGTSPAMTE